MPAYAGSWLDGGVRRDDRPSCRWGRGMTEDANMRRLKRKRLWTVSDFATWMGLTRKPAFALLKALDEELGGTLLRKSTGKKPEYSLIPALLAKSKPELFERVHGLELRIQSLEEWREEVDSTQRRTVAQVGYVTRCIEKLKRAG
jgi:hypothetical protein